MSGARVHYPENDWKIHFGYKRGTCVLLLPLGQYICGVDENKLNLGLCEFFIKKDKPASSDGATGWLDISKPL